MNNIKVKSVGASLEAPVFSFAPAEKLTQNVGISLGFYAAALGKVLRGDAPTDSAFTILLCG